MYSMTFIADEGTKVFEVEAGRTLLEVMQANDIDISFPCNGNHRCGKCHVIARGAMSPAGETERQFLGDDIDRDIRLACFAKIEGDVEVELLETKHSDRIALQFDVEIDTIDPIYEGDYGVAIDIGTTTIAAYLYCRDSLNILAMTGGINLQQRFGADVLSRIDYANKNGVEPLRDTVRKQVSVLISELCEQAGVPDEEIACACITGNTVMLHLLAGLDPRSLAMAPFDTVSLFGEFEDWRLPAFPNMAVFLPRCIAAYVGADVVCSMMAADLEHLPDNTLLIDIGTNGEMGLKADGRLICCSTAAGPAFEGAGISKGMPAKAGAISKVWAEGDTILYETIDDAKPVGLCGSGLIDAVGVACELGIINKRGKIVKPDREKAFEIGDSGILITQQDIRQLQLAKAAIRAGIDTMLELLDIRAETLHELILCGGFGSFLDPHSAAAIGMIPHELADKCRALGNGAGAGATLLLQSRDLTDRSRDLADRAEVIELSYSKEFSENYIEAMYF